MTRLESVPWRALEGLASTVEPALTAILSGAPAADVLDRLLRANRQFTSTQRTAVAEALFGVGLWRRRLRAHGRTTPLQLLATLALDLGKTDIAPLLGVTRPSLQSLTDWRDRASIPDWLGDVLKDEALASALNEPGPVTIRVNRLRGTRAELAKRLASEQRTTESAKWHADALHVTTRPANLTATAAWRAGWFEIQDEGSQFLTALVPDGDSILDLCAGAGGKTLGLASAFPRAKLHAFDIDGNRLERLRTRASRAGANVHIHHALPPELRVQHILVDAPCSELGALRRGPDLRWRLDPNSFDQWPPIQRALLERATRHLLPSGSITYATCTLRPEENDDVVRDFLAAHPNFHRERPNVPDVFLDDAGTFRSSPLHHGTDGFFGVILRNAE